MRIFKDWRVFDSKKNRWEITYLMVDLYLIILRLPIWLEKENLEDVRRREEIALKELRELFDVRLPDTKRKKVHKSPAKDTKPPRKKGV